MNATEPVARLADKDMSALAWAVRRAGKTSAAFKQELAAAERAIGRLRQLRAAGLHGRASGTELAANEPSCASENPATASSAHPGISERESRFI